MKKALVDNKVYYCIIDKTFSDCTNKYARHKHNTPDELVQIRRNRRRVASLLGRHDIVTLKQVHGARIVDITLERLAPDRVEVDEIGVSDIEADGTKIHGVEVGEAGGGKIKASENETSENETSENETSEAEASEAEAGEIEADGMMTSQAGVILAIQTADCVPVLLSCRRGSVVAALHCGWRSARAAIIEKALERFAIKYRIEAENILAVIGPAIAQKSYEVDSAFYDDFISETNSNKIYFIANNQSNNGKYFFDLPAYVKDKLKGAGVEIIEHVSDDTYENEEKYPSRRRAFHAGQEYQGNILSTIAILTQDI